MLRAFGEEDFPAYAALMGDEEVASRVGGVLAPEDAWRQMAAMLGHWALRGYGVWAVGSRSSGAFLGRCGFWFPHGWPEVEIGWAFARAAWGQGFATEAARAALVWGRSELRLTRITSVIAPANARSIAVAERLGWRTSARTRFAAHLSRSTRARCSRRLRDPSRTRPPSGAYCAP